MTARTTDSVVPAGVAAHHPATAETGAAVLAEGGNAADAAITASLTACVAETILTGLAGGGFAIYWEAATREATTLDFFVDIPRGTGSAPGELYRINFGNQDVDYLVGPATVAVPGVVPGLGALAERFGTRSWRDLVAPARRLAAVGVALPDTHATALEMLSSVLTLGDGGRIYAPAGTLLGSGDTLDQPGLERALAIIAEEGPTSFTTGTLAAMTAALMERLGGCVTAEDLAAYEPRWSNAVALDRGRGRLLTRAGDISRVRDVVAAVDAAGPQDATRRAVTLARALRDHAPGATEQATGTTNVTAVDHDGNACVISSSLGLGSGDFLPGLDVHLNSMLGETDLLVEADAAGGRAVGSRMASHMVPAIVADDDGLVAAAGAAGGSRIASGLLQCLFSVVDDGVEAQTAVDAPRWHPTAQVLHHEPGVDPSVVAALERLGWTPNPWPRRSYYFGGVNLIGRTGGAGEPRRSGAVRLVGS